MQHFPFWMAEQIKKNEQISPATKKIIHDLNNSSCEVPLNYHHNIIHFQNWIFINLHFLSPTFIGTHKDAN